MTKTDARPLSIPEALQAAIKANPDEDTIKLELADYWDEHDSTQPSQEAGKLRLAVALKRVIADKDDDAPRLDFAIICEHYGDYDWAELIRVQCELAKDWANATLRNREQQLLTPINTIVWGAEFPFSASVSDERDHGTMWRRGFPWSIRVNGDQWTRLGDDACKAAPIERVEFTDMDINYRIFGRDSYEIAGKVIHMPEDALRRKSISYHSRVLHCVDLPHSRALLSARWPIKPEGWVFPRPTGSGESYGTDGQILVADSTAPDGLKWITPPELGEVPDDANLVMVRARRRYMAAAAVQEQAIRVFRRKDGSPLQTGDLSFVQGSQNHPALHVQCACIKAERVARVQPDESGWYKPVSLDTRQSVTLEEWTWVRSVHPGFVATAGQCDRCASVFLCLVPADSPT